MRIDFIVKFVIVFVMFLAVVAYLVLFYERDVESSNVVYYHLEELPKSLPDGYDDVLRDASDYWSNHMNVTFEQKQDALVRVSFVKDFGVSKLGHVVNGDVVQIAYGDSESGVWRAYSYDTVKIVAIHEFGHVLGLSHNNVSGDVMNAYLDRYYADTKEKVEVVFPEHFVCNRACNPGYKLIRGDGGCYCEPEWTDDNGECELGEPDISNDCVQYLECPEGQELVEGVCINPDLWIIN